MGSIISGVIEFTVARSAHLNCLPVPIPNARQTFISSSIGKCSDVFSVVIVDEEDVVHVVPMDVWKFNEDVVVTDDDDDLVVIDDDDDLVVIDDDDDLVVIDDDDLGIAVDVNEGDIDAVFCEEHVVDDNDDDGVVVDKDDVVVETIFGMNSMLLYFLMPSHLIFGFGFDVGREQERTVR